MIQGGRDMTVQLSTREQDALKEVATIGSGNAATALSQMLKKGVSIKVPRANLHSIEEVPELFGSAERLVSAVYLRFLGDVSGVILLTMSKEETNRLADLLLGQAIGTTKLLNEMSQSALKEATSILSGAYLNAMSKFLSLRLLLTSPAMAQDMAGAILDNILIETAKEADYAIVLDTEFDIRDEKVIAYFFFVPDTDSLKRIIKILGVNSRDK